MKKLLRLTFMSLLTMLSTAALAQSTVTFNATIDKGNFADYADAGKDEVVKSGITISASNGVFAAVNYKTKAGEYRVYKNSKFTVSSTVGNITKVVVTCTANGDAKQGPGNFTTPTVGEYTFEAEGKTGTWKGDAASFTLTASKNQVRMTKVEVTYTPNGKKPVTVEKPSITGNTPFDETTTVTITVPEGTTVYYTTDGSEPSDQGDDYSDPITLNETTTVKAVAYDKDGNASQIVTKQFVKNVKTAHAGTKADPYSVTDVIAMNNAGSLPKGEVYVTGTISKVGKFDSGRGQVSYYITTPNTADTLYVYGGLYLDGEKFTSADQIKVGDVVTILGKLTVYGKTLEFNFLNKIVKLENGGTIVGEPLPYEGLITGQGDFEVKETLNADNLDKVYEWGSNGKVSYMKFNAYINRKAHDYTAYLISPVLDLTVKNEGYVPVLSFEHTGKYFKNVAEEATLWVINPATKDTTQITIPNYFTQKNWDFVANRIELSEYKGQKVQFAFKYVTKATNGKDAGTWEIKNFSVKEDVPTGIGSVEAAKVNVNAPLYNLAGQRVDKSYKGVVIQNGRKFINK